MMQAYLNDPALKAMMLEETAEHRAQDQLVRGSYESKDEKGKFRGCAVGCAIHSLNKRLNKTLSCSNHAVYETELGVPRRLARLEDVLFERLPDKEAMAWPQRFLEAIPVGADLDHVADHFLHWLLVDPERGVIRHTAEPEIQEAINRVGELYQRQAGGEVIPQKAWRQAGDRAWEIRRKFWPTADDAAATADDAADAAAADAAAAAADAAADAAAADAAAAAAAAAAADAWRTSRWGEVRMAAHVCQSEKLLELLAAAPVPASA